MLQKMTAILDARAATLPVEVRAKLRADILRLDNVAGGLLDMALDTEQHVLPRPLAWGVCCLIDGNLRGLPGDGDHALGEESGRYLAQTESAEYQAGMSADAGAARWLMAA